jgi:type 1 fimbria pilin
MNKHLSLLTAALLLTGASSAFAASQTDLTVTGTITPVACEPTLANGGVVNYGKISVQDLRETEHTPLGIETIQLTVSCDASAQFAISTIDNQPNTNVTGQFGLGLINGNEKLGGYNLGFRNPVADQSVVALVSSDGEKWFRHLDDEGIIKNQWIAFGNRTGSVWAPDFLQAVTTDIWVYAYIARADSLTLTDEVKLDGKVTLQIEYL